MLDEIYMFNFGSFGMKLDSEEMFILVVKSVARWVCGVPDGPQIGSIPSLPLDKVAGGVRDDTDRKF